MKTSRIATIIDKNWSNQNKTLRCKIQILSSIVVSIFERINQGFNPYTSRRSNQIDPNVLPTLPFRKGLKPKSHQHGWLLIKILSSVITKKITLNISLIKHHAVTGLKIRRFTVRENALLLPQMHANLNRSLKTNFNIIRFKNVWTKSFF